MELGNKSDDDEMELGNIRLVDGLAIGDFFFEKFFFAPRLHLINVDTIPPISNGI